MSNDRVIPTPAPPDVVTFTVLVDGEQILDTFNVLSINVVKEINKIPYAKIVLKDGDPSLEDFEVSNTEVFIPGNEIEVLAGYRSEESTIFKGIIIKHGIKVKKSKASVLVVECRDESVKLTVGRKNKYYYEIKDSEVIEEILSNYDLEKKVETTEVKHKELVQYYSTDWDFILSRADVNGKLVFVDDGKILINKPDLKQESVLSLIYGATILEFEAEMDARTQFSSVKSKTWDYANQEIIESDSEDPAITEQGNLSSDDLSDVIGLDALEIQHAGEISNQELQSWANAGMLRSRLAKIQGRVSFQGCADVKPGNIIKLNGVGERFNGNVFVSAIRQEISGGNWATNVQFGLSPEWFSKRNDIIDTQASGLLPAVSGLQTGKVTQLQDDPDGEDRILVKVPVIDNQEEGIWARVATLDAGENRGTFFRPEIDDEVIIGYLNDDPRNPVILGMLNSSAKPAPITASDDNHEKGYVSREKLKLIFNDELKSIKVETPNGNSITLNEDDGTIVIVDENDNKIEMSSDGINIESNGDINIKANGDVNIEGTNVSQKANAQFKAEGSAGAELSTSATAVIKGSVVQIN